MIASMVGLTRESTEDVLKDIELVSHAAILRVAHSIVESLASQHREPPASIFLDEHANVLSH